MKNPFPKNNGFDNHLQYAKTTIYEYGKNQDSEDNYNNILNNRKFDDCFENGDGDALVFALMREVQTNSNLYLLNGISAMGTLMKWTNFYTKKIKKQNNNSM